MPVCTLDFNRLYPSIMEEHRLCYSNYVLEGTVDIYTQIPKNNNLQVCSRARKQICAHLRANLPFFCVLLR